MHAALQPGLPDRPTTKIVRSGMRSIIKEKNKERTDCNLGQEGSLVALMVYCY